MKKEGIEAILREGDRNWRAIERERRRGVAGEKSSPGAAYVRRSKNPCLDCAEQSSMYYSRGCHLDICQLESVLVADVSRVECS